jgi:hypothetical protein
MSTAPDLRIVNAGLRIRSVAELHADLASGCESLGALDADDTRAGTKLPSFEAKTKAKDPRYSWFVPRYGKRCWEVDALSPVVLRERVEGAITAMLNMDVWRHAVSVEKAERDSMEEILSTWPGISRQAPNYSGGSP